ncbi:uncharacterized protein LOC130053831 [Ostrea edulis]|uniref:uncharacterized protein LOC130053831 n=1 Tax=Ostrea edulis TaxID=37623 RepID=UPI0024AFCC01|nr:uncharacterized protein LOC130053831 [Ostrea edulis]
MSIDFNRESQNSIEPDTSYICENGTCPRPCGSSCSYDVNKVYRVTSNKDVYVTLGNTTVMEMFHALNDDHLGTEYVASVYIDVTGQSFLGVGNPSDSVVTVDITLPEVNNYSLTECNNKTITFSLQSLEAKTLDFLCDVTGAYINSTGNIIAYVASFSLMGPSMGSDLQFMVEQLIPINHLGNFYIVVPYGENSYGDVISLVTTQDDTFVHISGYDYATLPNRFDNIRRRLEGKKPVTVRSSKPVSVTQFAVDAANKSAMVINVPATFNTDVVSLMIEPGVFYSFMNNTKTASEDDNAPLTYFYANRARDKPNTNAFACTIYDVSGYDFGGSFCGFLPSEHIVSIF